MATEKQSTRDATKKRIAPQLAALGRALCVARTKIAPDITAQRLSILLAVHAHEGLSQRELHECLESTSIPALSRNLADLSPFTSRKTPGPNLIELRSDPMNLRVRRVYLTRKGRALIKALEGAMAQAGQA